MKDSNIPQASTEKDDIVANILEFLPAECGMKVQLPSNGQFYKTGSREVKVKPLTFEGEKKLLTANRSDINPVTMLLELCVEGVNIEDLCVMDRLYLVIKIRESSHGEEITTTGVCNHCTGESELTVLLSQLNVNYIPEDMTDPHQFTLEGIKKDVEVRLPRVYDDKFLQDPEVILNNLWRFVTSISGHTDASIIAKVIPQLGTRDRHTLIKEIMTPHYGVDTKVKFICDKCQRVNILDLPITEDFFTVK